MPSCHPAADEVILIPPHAAHGHVACRPHERDIKPDGDVLQLGPLLLVNRAGVARPDWVGRHGAAVLHPLGDGVADEGSARLGADVEAAGVGVVALNHGLHPVHEVGLLVQVLGQVDPRALEDLREGRLRGTAGDQAVLLVVVCLVGLPVHGQLRQRPLLPPGEEHKGGQVVHLGGVATSASDDSGVGVGAVELRQIPSRGLVVAGPSFVARANLPQQGLVRHGRSECQELLLQDIVLAAPHGVELNFQDLPPARAVLGLAALDAWQLPEIAGKHKHRQLVSRLPHLVDALEVALRELGHLVYDHEVVAVQEVHGFQGVLVEQKGACARVHIRLRVSLPRSRGLQTRGKREEHPAPVPLHLPRDLVQDGRLARARGAQSC